MASTGFVAEFSKKPPAVKLGAFLAIVLVLGGLYYQLLYSKLSKDLTAAEEQAVALNKSENQTDEDEVEFVALNGKDQERQDKLARFEQALPLNADVDAIYGIIRSRAQDACKVEPLNMKVGKEVPLEDDLWKIPVEVQLECSYDGLKKFFYMLYRMSQDEEEDDKRFVAPPEPECEPYKPKKGSDEEKELLEREQKRLARRERVITIEDLSIVITDLEKKKKAGDAPAPTSVAQAGAGPLLTATFKASAFRREIPEQEAEDPKKAKDAKAKGAAQDAKDKTEDAMKKSEERVDSAAEKAGADKVKGGI